MKLLVGVAGQFSLIAHKNNGIIEKKVQRERGVVYETLCYVCIALAIAIKNNGCYRLSVHLYIH